MGRDVLLILLELGSDSGVSLLAQHRAASASKSPPSSEGTGVQVEQGDKQCIILFPCNSFDHLRMIRRYLFGNSVATFNGALILRSDASMCVTVSFLSLITFAPSDHAFSYV